MWLNTPSPGHTLGSPRVSRDMRPVAVCGVLVQISRPKLTRIFCGACREPRLAWLLGASHEVSWVQSTRRAPEGTEYANSTICVLNMCCITLITLALVEPLPGNLPDRQERPTVEKFVQDAKSLWQTGVWLFSSHFCSTSGHQAAP